MSQEKHRKKIFYGWWVVAGCSMIALLSASSRFSFTMFLPYLIEDLGWTRATLGFGLTLHMWIYGIGAFASGFIVDRYGPRVLMIVGGFIIMVSLVLTSRMNEPLQFYIFYGVILAIGVSATLVVPNASTARKWFVRKGGLAVALIIVGMTLGISIISLIIPDLIDAFGWRKSWFYIGLIMGAVIMGISWIVVRKDPESMGLYPDGEQGSRRVSESADVSPIDETEWTVREAVRTRSYWLLLFANSVFIIPVMGFMGHVAAWGFDIAKAANVPEVSATGMVKLSIFLLGIASITGALIGGPLSDKYGRKPVLVTGFILQIFLIVYAVNVDRMSGIVIFSLSAGIVGGILTPLWAPYVGDIFGRVSLASLFGMIVFAVGIIGGTGPFLFGWIFDLTGSYFWAFIFSGCCYLVAMILIIFIRKEEKEPGSMMKGEEEITYSTI
ncbi:MAG: MFS transporter [Desulfobacterales bacterium]